MLTVYLLSWNQTELSFLQRTKAKWSPQSFFIQVVRKRISIPQCDLKPKNVDPKTYMPDWKCFTYTSERTTPLSITWPFNM